MPLLQMILDQQVAAAARVIHPLTQRLLHPMEASDPKEMAALQKRKGKGLGLPGLGKPERGFSFKTMPSFFRKDSDGGTAACGQIDDEDVNTVGFSSRNNSPGVWTYERVVSTQEVAAAFEEFSRKALCQESFFFLRDAMTYQTEYFTDVEQGEEKHDNDDCGGGNEKEGGDVLDEERFAFLAKVVKEYIADGAPNEINIGSRDKRNILDVHKLGKGGFHKLPLEEKRCVLAKAYSEIRFMLESNLMRKFVATDGFKEAEAMARANGTLYRKEVPGI
eukprot:g16291.t1